MYTTTTNTLSTCMHSYKERREEYRDGIKAGEKIGMVCDADPRAL